MSNYPALTEMGISNPEEITRYSLQTIHNIDFLRIVYKRKKGSLLASSKKFRFGRAEKMVVTDSGKQTTEVIHEISPFVIKATNELKSIVQRKHSRSEQKETIADEIHRLEVEMNTRINYLKSLVEKLD